MFICRVRSFLVRAFEGSPLWVALVSPICKLSVSLSVSLSAYHRLCDVYRGAMHIGEMTAKGNLAVLSSS